MSGLEIALGYLRRGWSPIPIPYKTKAPLDKGWQAKVVTKETVHQYFNCEPQNIGVRLGELSGGLADVDLDSREAVRAAPYFLRPTLCFGRPGKPQSHWLYQSDLCQTEDKAEIRFTFITGTGKERTTQSILELRIGGGGKGAQTVFPGSVHETGEAITWKGQEPIARADGDDLKQRCARAASAALLAAHFPSKGSRQQPVVDFAKELDIAVIGIGHLTKGTAGKDPLERINGSGAFGALPRLVMGAAKNEAEADDDQPERIMVRIKSNIGPSGGGFGYHINMAPLVEQPDVEATRIVWGLPLEGTARELLNEAEGEQGGKVTKLERAKRFLTNMLANAKRLATEIEEAAVLEGLSWASVRRASDEMPIRKFKAGDRSWWEIT